MALNTKRNARMRQMSVAQLLVVYKAGTLSSAAAGYHLLQQGVRLPIRDFVKDHPRRLC